MAMQSMNPATGAHNAEFDLWDEATIEQTVTDAGMLWTQWAKEVPLEHRCQLLKRLGDVLLDDREPLAELITLEMGKLYKEALAEVDKCAQLCDYYAEKAPEFLADEPLESGGSRSYLTYKPLGVVLGVMPWNFPLWQVFRFAVPTITAGNIALVKHASNVPQCALAIEEVFRKAGYPEGVYQHMLISASQVEPVIRNKVIKAVSLTGSEPAGRKVAAVAGSELKKCVLELGGSDAFVILDDVDMAMAVAGAVKGRFQNCGQSCIAAKRFIVDAYRHDEFVAQFKEAVESQLQAGDPMDADTTLAPMARQDLLEELDAQVQKSVQMGAKLVTGGYQLDCPGSYYAPTILTDVTSAMPAYHEEMFGPVATVLKASEPAHAVGLANATDFGLGGSVWGKDAATCETIARNIESGASYVNSITFSDPRLPFGGIRHSGYGRELSREGIREFTNIKTIYIH
ncbi:MAG: NAD-dependent succinate-semialdehyde dehydrogenase [Hydrogenovibrio sp.]|uniref:NAD-dependent succinate-semialdehyde dehydrogenase n=1 Tax=Hydrogenovibrio sp. TaxID=2065821 RepID=UPI00286FC19A|nr:NAD-dependent succinate-semialdehyde dehydrogenase [Hydrogenovibrio sp.]MDR9498981.1 NAD-dependent succinate-semialdehyde dehydrogenase [Hydrogenovibrio sp.]